MFLSWEDDACVALLHRARACLLGLATSRCCGRRPCRIGAESLLLLLLRCLLLGYLLLATPAAGSLLQALQLEPCRAAHWGACDGAPPRCMWCSGYSHAGAAALPLYQIAAPLPPPGSLLATMQQVTPERAGRVTRCGSSAHLLLASQLLQVAGCGSYNAVTPLAPVAASCSAAVAASAPPPGCRRLRVTAATLSSRCNQRSVAFGSHGCQPFLLRSADRRWRLFQHW